jgi:DNA-binding NarL/FixJ family response regulator
MPIRVAIADDHPVARQGLREYLQTEADMTIVAEADSGLALLEALDRLEVLPDVALVDARMPSLDGVEATRAILDRFAGVRVIVLSAFDDPNLVFRAIGAGARAYLLKSKDGGQITQAIRLVADGDLVIDRQVAPPILRRLPDHLPVTRASEALSDPEVEILRLLSRGQTNKEIARELQVSPETVKGRLGRVFRKLGANDRAAAVAEGLRRNVIE